MVGGYVSVAMFSWVCFARMAYADDVNLDDAVSVSIFGALLWPIVWTAILGIRINRVVQPLRWLIPSAYADREREREVEDLRSRANQLRIDSDVIGGEVGKGLRDMAAELDRQAEERSRI